MNVDTSRWSGEGEFTQLLLERLQTIGQVALLRVEDAPATRSDADYNFVSNEVYVVFAGSGGGWFRRFLAQWREADPPPMTLRDLERLLTATEEVGAPDYSDEGMLQYLRAERVVPPYQTRGYKIVELVRIYDVSAGRSRRGNGAKDSNRQ